jgi:hypothetical protein
MTDLPAFVEDTSLHHGVGSPENSLDSPAKATPVVSHRLPKQVDMLFGASGVSLSDSQLSFLEGLYSGEKEFPSFEEWLESYQASGLFKAVLDGESLIASLRKKHVELQSQKEVMSPDDFNREERRLLRLIDAVSAQWLSFHKELRVLVQTKLGREAPRKVEVTQHRVTPVEVAGLLRQARSRVVDVQEGDGS